jgi:hypothetical protein
MEVWYGSKSKGGTGAAVDAAGTFGMGLGRSPAGTLSFTSTSSSRWKFSDMNIADADECKLLSPIGRKPRLSINSIAPFAGSTFSTNALLDALIDRYLCVLTVRKVRINDQKENPRSSICFKGYNSYFGSAGLLAMLVTYFVMVTMHVVDTASKLFRSN